MTSKGKKSVEQIKREIAEVLYGRQVERGETRASPVTEGSSPETKRDVLRDLNRRYKRSFGEPWRMLAYLRLEADQLARRGHRESDHFRGVVADYDRLRRAVDDLA